ncbi:MAG: Chemotaxis protein cheW [Candidatus Magnetoglobus multicellularis str. Araruama]|uniref:Chemotaxis protein cheW n=1 Tax=Candidatus Magnetoglobus multicellularis str. Araruama TaxID=890399 RepID=A0A1V1PGJ9_9BACT|nr:MAG: Chemotaxis protein cheW [Candidatus Magnetoglobus multicellularis str. Araruama]
MNKQTHEEPTQYLTFRLEDEIFAVNVNLVHEVLDWTSITVVPRAPEFMRGVINVRGSVVPVADLRLKFGMTETQKTIHTRIIVMELSIDNESTILGIMADAVKEVIELSPEHIENPPKVGSRWRTEYILGIGKHHEKFIILLDMERIFSSIESPLIEENQTSMEENHATS